MYAWSSLLQYRMISYLMSAFIFFLRRGRSRLFSRCLMRCRFRGRRLTCETVRGWHATDLFDLIRLRLIAARLQIQHFRHAFTGEYVVIAAHALGKAHAGQHGAEVMEADLLVGIATETAI